MAAAIGLISTIASVGMQMGAANYQAQVADINAQIAEENANREMFRSQEEERDVGLESGGRIGELVAGQSASGVSLGKGSAPLVRSHAARLGRRDVLRTRAAGENQAYAYLVDQFNYKAQAEAARGEASASLLGGFLSGLGQVVGGIGGSSSSLQPSLIGGSTTLRDRRKFL